MSKANTMSDPFSEKEMRKREARWRAEGDLRSLIEAEKVRSDPERMKAAEVVRQEQLAELEKIKAD